MTSFLPQAQNLPINHCSKSRLDVFYVYTIQPVVNIADVRESLHIFGRRSFRNWKLSPILLLFLRLIPVQFAVVQSCPVKLWKQPNLIILSLVFIRVSRQLCSEWRFLLLQPGNFLAFYFVLLLCESNVYSMNYPFILTTTCLIKNQII